MFASRPFQLGFWNVGDEVASQDEGKSDVSEVNLRGGVGNASLLNVWGSLNKNIFCFLTIIKLRSV